MPLNLKLAVVTSMFLVRKVSLVFIPHHSVPPFGFFLFRKKHERQEENFRKNHVAFAFEHKNSERERKNLDVYHQQI